MSRRGWNLKAGTPQRAAADRKIRERYRHQPAAETSYEYTESSNGSNPDLHPNAQERQQAVWAMREVRRQHWAVPTLDSDGHLVPRPMPEVYTLEWESIEEIAKEVPDYLGLGWRVEETPLGLAVTDGQRLPQLIDEQEVVTVVPDWAEQGRP
jgi:hypothetical protein